jgi:hypothetical protein
LFSFAERLTFINFSGMTEFSRLLEFIIRERFDKPIFQEKCRACFMRAVQQDCPQFTSLFVSLVRGRYHCSLETRSPIHAAIDTKNHSIFRTLAHLESKNPVFWNANKFAPPLVSAIWSKDDTMITDLIRFSNVNAQLYLGRSYLHIAAMTSNISIFQMIYHLVKKKLPFYDYGYSPIDVIYDDFFRNVLTTFYKVNASWKKSKVM